MVLLSAGVFLLTYKNAIHFFRKTIRHGHQIWKKGVSFFFQPVTAFCRFTRIMRWEYRLQSLILMKENIKRTHNKALRMVSSITAKSQDAGFFFSSKPDCGKCPGTRVPSKFNMKANEVTAWPLKTQSHWKRDRHTTDRTKWRLSSSKKHFYE